MPTNNIGRETITFTIQNEMGPPRPCFLYMYGTTNPLKPQGNTYYLSNPSNGDCTKFEANTKGRTYGSSLNIGKTNYRFPQLDAVRVYISLGNELKIDTDKDAIPIAPSADNPGAPNFNDIWDFVEATWHDYGDRTILHVNTTQVDAFGLAFKIEHSGYNPAKPDDKLTVVNGFDSNNARKTIFDEIRAAGPPWNNLFVGGGARILMPLKSMDQNKFPKNQLDAYIADVGKFYQRDNHLTFKHEGVDYVGTTDSSGNFIFQPPTDSGKKTYKISKPTTRECYAQNIVASPNDGVGSVICAALGASFVRSTLRFYEEFPVPQKLRRYFYREPPRCEYARIIHEQGIDYHAFCYGYDEVEGDAGGNRDVVNPTSFTLTINGV